MIDLSRYASQSTRRSIVSDITPENLDENIGYNNQVLSRFITQALNMVKSGIIHNMSRKKKIASGLTTNSLKVVRDTSLSGFITSDSRGLEFAQTGRSRGKVPHHFDVILRRWMKDKGIVPYSTRKNKSRKSSPEAIMKRAAHNIAHSIYTRGTLQKRQGWTNIYTHEISQAKVWLRRRVSGSTMQSIRKYFIK